MHFGQLLQKVTYAYLIKIQIGDFSVFGLSSASTGQATKLPGALVFPGSAPTATSTTSVKDVWALPSKP
ncbi:hypothetical protein KIN20_010452 [Parelaphostrongylus tenuis]|uniref:Uncharacterized protein n=1 Tax=Parelaphostrongylus tenuis TaxID=148309 RepID=A0AAD5MCK6_PARTN|nr:hypothetical protein KIN20_010452 [Parelaphostrongylus tenuis]